MIETLEQKPSGGVLRIGELSRRVGVRPETLRAWERRYDLLEPRRSEAGYRLYSRDDEARVRGMVELIDQGVSAAEAAKLAREDALPAVRTGPGATEAGRAASLSDPAPAVPLALDQVDAGAVPASALGSASTVSRARERMLETVERFDAQALNAILDQALMRFPIEVVVGEIVLAALAEVGDRWAEGEMSVAHEHFCSEVLRGRLLGLARGWTIEAGPLALLACPPGERHDLGLLAFGVALRDAGWRVAYLGHDTPLGTLGETADRLAPARVIVAALERSRFETAATELANLSRRHSVLIAGAGADPELAAELGAGHLGGDPVRAAAAVVAEAR